MFLMSGVGDRAGKVVVDEDTLRVVAYCPSEDDAARIVKLSNVVLNENMIERNEQLRVKNTLLFGLLADLLEWSKSVPEPLPVGLNERVRTAIGRQERKPQVKEAASC